MKSACTLSKYYESIGSQISFEEEPFIIPREGHEVINPKKVRVPFTAVLAHEFRRRRGLGA